MGIGVKKKEKPYIIFGAGYYGEEALWYYGKANVAYFCDNKKCGQIIKGIKVIDAQRLCEIWKGYEVILAVIAEPARTEIIGQLKENNIAYSCYCTQEARILEDNFAGKYHFNNRSKQSEQLLIVLAGYKPYLWGPVFRRLKKFCPPEIDICVLTAGYRNQELDGLCAQEGWSYLYSEENKLAVVQNCAIKEHPNAKWIYKMDEDIFVTEGLFQELYHTFQEVTQEKKHQIGFVAPLMAVNGYGYRRILEYLDCLEEYRKLFGDAYYGLGKIYFDPLAAGFMWDKTLPIDQFADRLKRKKGKYSICYHRFSIGFILIHRDVWASMGGFCNAPEGILGIDEENLCKYCMGAFKAIIIAESAFAGHFAYGRQEKGMRKVYEKRRREFDQICGDNEPSRTGT